MSLLLAFLALSGPTVPDRDPDILFSKSQTFDSRLDTVEIWLGSTWADGTGLTPTYVMRRTVSYRPDLNIRGQTVLWSTEKNCPQAFSLMRRLNDFPTPRVILGRLPPNDDATATTARADGASYRLKVEAYYPFEAGEVDLLFSVGTPVANWVDESFRQFAPCWLKDIPKGR